jgi:hypothetical protein
METLDSRVGMENVLLYIFPTGYFSDTLATEEKYRIPTGDFSTKRCMSLLNSFLSAKYGNAEYVGAMCGPQVYFNTKVIEDKRLDVNNVEREARDFIAKMSGVEDVYTLSDILDAASDELQALRRSTAANYAGNLYVKVQAGWNLVDDCNYPTTTRTIRYDMVATPAFIFYPPIKQRTIENPVDGVVLAPTVCRILRIRSPNGAVKRGISLQ